MGRGYKIPERTRQKVLDAVNAGIKYSDIADSLKIGRTSVRRIAEAGIKKSPKTVSTPIEPVPEDITADNNISTYSISEVPEVVKPELDYEEQKAYIADILKATLEDISEEVRSFEERIKQLQDCLEERRQKQAYLRDFIRSME